MNQWIPVTERLPEIPADNFFTNVLAYCNDDFRVVAADYCAVGPTWYVAFDDTPLLRVTHWMPMPEPPAL